MVVGDNLGLNSFLNFSKSFSSNYCCRFCKANKLESQSLCISKPELQRTKETYALNLTGTDSKGVLGECLLNKLPSFHVVTNYYVDVMHDIFEGICHYNMTNAIIYFTQEMKYFNLELLNLRKQTFEYGSAEIGNNSGKIESNHLNKRKLKMSAREMMTFVNFFPLMIGDMVPCDDPVWKFLINFFEILDILLCFQITDTDISLLREKIKQHNSDYIVIFKDTLKPKFHNLTHYPTIIRQSGPLRNLWCFKYESKHRQFKIYSHCITSRKNICLTLAKKYELKFAYQLTKPSDNSELSTKEKYKIKSAYHTIIQEKINVVQHLESYSIIHFRETEYKIGHYVVTYESNIKFHIILEIIITEFNEALFLCQTINKIEYIDHFLSFDIDVRSLGAFLIISVNDLIGPPLALIKTARGKTMLRIKEYYKCIS